jgi:hypothetical protein
MFNENFVIQTVWLMAVLSSVYALFNYNSCFSFLQPLSKMLQSHDLDLFAAAKMVNRTKNQIFAIRNYDNFQKILTQAK